MPFAPVSRARLGSNEVVIVCETVPGAATGTDEETVNDPPPFAEMLCELDEIVTARATADAGGFAETTPKTEVQIDRRIAVSNKRFISVETPYFL
jgi:hypothetical protein